MLFLVTETQTIYDNPGFFDAIAEMIAACRDRIEEVIGRGNLKWALLFLFLILLLWYAKRSRLTSL